MWSGDRERRRTPTNYIGKTPKEYIKDHPNRIVRVLRKGSFYTMDYCEERVNLDVDDSEKITKVWLG